MATAVSDTRFEPTFGVLGRLVGAVDAVVAIDPAELSDVALADSLVTLRREMDRQEAEFARLAHAAHTRGVGASDGAVSTAAWLRHRVGMREGDAKAAIECGAVSELLPRAGRAWRDGEISTGAARTIAAARVEGHDGQLQGCEEAFLDLARAGNRRDLRRATAHFRNVARADSREPRMPDGLHFSKTFASRTVLSGEFGDLGAETIATALDAYTDPPDTEAPRPTSERTAAAFVRICEVAIAHLSDEKRPTAAVTMMAAWETITEGKPGLCDGVFTGPIHPDDMRKALCDCSVSRVVTGPKSEPLDVGRARYTVPPPMRRALVVRDQGCRFPGCIHPPGYCDAHHLVHWIDGGETSITNAALFCDRHHHVLHQRDWKAVLDGTTIRVYRADGSEVSA